MKKDSLVLYKQSPAVVSAIGDKIDILLPSGKTRSVREKDVFLLHPGPVGNVSALEENAPEGQPEEAWELLQGESPSLKDLAELAFGEHTPATAWLAFKLLNRSPWFRGTPEAIEVVSPDIAAARIQAENDKRQAEEQWNDFIDRFRRKNAHPVKDEPFLRDLEMCALGRSKGSRILKTLGKIQTPENAHRVMVQHKVVPACWNPHPLRLNVPLDVPDYPLGELEELERLDLTGMEAFAIDDEGNEDPDDAVSWDGERFWIHVADAAGLVAAGSAEDAFARERASSLYLPETVVPMLPREAVGRLGLGLHETSPALSYSFVPDAEMTLKDFSVHLTTVRVTRLTYARADSLLEQGQEPLSSIKGFADRFRERRLAAGAVSINMPEVKIHADSAGTVSITALPDSASRNMVAEAMLMAGAGAARWCMDKGVPIPFAVQDVPDSSEAALAGAENAAAPPPAAPQDATPPAAVSPADAPPPAAPQAADSGNPAAEGTHSPENSTLCGGRAAHFVDQFERRRGMKRSRTTLECAPHAGLGLTAYSRVTSPLRRYPDLLASRQIRNTLLGRPLEDRESVLAGLAEYESRLGSLVQAERRSNLFWKLQWLKQRPGWSGQAVLLDRREHQGYFLIPELAMEIRVSLKKPLSIGSCVMLKLREVDIAESSVLFVVNHLEGKK